MQVLTPDVKGRIFPSIPVTQTRIARLEWLLLGRQENFEFLGVLACALAILSVALTYSMFDIQSGPTKLNVEVLADNSVDIN